MAKGIRSIGFGCAEFIYGVWAGPLGGGTWGEPGRLLEKRSCGKPQEHFWMVLGDPHLPGLGQKPPRAAPLATHPRAGRTGALLEREVPREQPWKWMP
jgi:hypothetical protein